VFDHADKPWLWRKPATAIHRSDACNGSPAQGPISAIQWCASPGPGTCVSQNVKPGVTISQTGLAHCDAGSAGTWTINADSPPVQASQPGGEFGASIVVGSATLTCP
jgi:hypothetical protein